MKVVDARSGDVLSVGSIVRYPDGETLRLDAVYEGLLVSRAMISTLRRELGGAGRLLADTRVVDLRVRYLHPAFLLQKVGFIEN